MTNLVSRRCRRHLLVLVAAALIGESSHARAADARLTLLPGEPWSDLFGDQEVKRSFQVRATEAWQGRVAWRFTAGGQTLASGESPAAAAPGKPATIAIRLPVPPVRDGVVLETRLVVAAYAAGAARPEATRGSTFWVFPRDPFADRGEWLKARKITLFDPRETTAPVLRKAGVPFAQTRNVDALGGLREGLLVVGEGVSFKEERGLPEVLLRAASRGLPVLCLAPAEGTFPIPGVDHAPPPTPAGLAFRQQDVIGRLDRRLDTAWPPDGKVVASRIALRSDGTAVVGEAGTGADGWPWLEIEYPDKGGRLLLCGFGIITHWEAGPAPRFLFAQLLQLLAGEHPGG
jgi:hypothetical protein